MAVSSSLAGSSLSSPSTDVACSLDLDLRKAGGSVSKTAMHLAILLVRFAAGRWLGGRWICDETMCEAVTGRGWHGKDSLTESSWMSTDVGIEDAPSTYVPPKTAQALLVSLWLLVVLRKGKRTDRNLVLLHLPRHIALPRRIRVRTSLPTSSIFSLGAVRVKSHLREKYNEQWRR
jgi:hypothetical protein